MSRCGRRAPYSTCAERDRRGCLLAHPTALAPGETVRTSICQICIPQLTFSPFRSIVRLYAILPWCPTIQASGLSFSESPTRSSLLSPPPNSLLLRRPFFAIPSVGANKPLFASPLGVPGRLLVNRDGEELRDGREGIEGGGSSAAGADSTGCIVGGLLAGYWGTGGGGYSTVGPREAYSYSKLSAKFTKKIFGHSYHSLFHAGKTASRIVGCDGSCSARRRRTSSAGKH
jgi:hypothetical protein